MTKESAIVVPIICALVVAIAPHTLGLPLWINAWCLVMWGYMLIRLKTGWPLPGARIRYGLAATGIIGLLLTYRVQIGADAFIGLLALMAAIKPFEMATHRHQMITVLLTYFIIITSLFRSESMFIVIYMFFSVLITTIALVRINAPRDKFKESVNLGGKILAQAIPLMVLLFLLFPRLPGSLFGIEDKSLGRTGFSDRLSPGSVTSMAQDHTPAFRAEFRGPGPAENQLYWKGIVFQKFDGKTWTTQEVALPPSPTLVFPGETHTYTILLEPHNSPWLMALDRPIKGPTWALLTAGQVLKSQRPVKQRRQYTVTSLTRDSFMTMDKKNMTAANAGRLFPGTQDDSADPMPAHISVQVLAKKMAASIISTATAKNPRTRSLARKLVEKAASPPEKIQALLAYFTKNQFAYTLNPPKAQDHPIDFFLFESKQGYCEHFASAFAFMMNVLEVPARVVGGYLGGEHNPYGNYLTIRQSYAHAWVEIFDPKNGWIRVDPTMAVAPERMETNPDGSSTALQSSAGFFSFSQRLTFALDAANMRWEAWFTGYSYFEQKAFLEKLGLGKWTGIAGTPLILSLLALVTLAGFSGVLVWLFQIRRGQPDPVQQAYGLFCRRLDKLGLTKPSDQGAIDFAKISCKTRPDLQTTIMTITDLYVQLRFQKECPDTTLAEFKTRIKNFNPKPVRPPKTPLSKDPTH
jgi:transglutaminase-like putative cysteine protease